MKKQLKATVLAAAGSAMLAIGMAGCDASKTSTPAPAPEKAKTEAAPAVEKAKTEAVPVTAEDPAKAKPKDHPAH